MTALQKALRSTPSPSLLIHRAGGRDCFENEMKRGRDKPSHIPLLLPLTDQNQKLGGGWGKGAWFRYLALWPIPLGFEMRVPQVVLIRSQHHSQSLIFESKEGHQSWGGLRGMEGEAEAETWSAPLGHRPHPRPPPSSARTHPCMCSGPQMAVTWQLPPSLRAPLPPPAWAGSPRCTSSAPQMATAPARINHISIQCALPPAPPILSP